MAKKGARCCARCRSSLCFCLVGGALGGSPARHLDTACRSCRVVASGRAGRASFAFAAPSGAPMKLREFALLPALHTREQHARRQLEKPEASGSLPNSLRTSLAPPLAVRRFVHAFRRTNGKKKKKRNGRTRDVCTQKKKESSLKSYTRKICARRPFQRVLDGCSKKFTIPQPRAFTLVYS